MAIFPFTPNNYIPFQFNPTLDGSPYTCIVTWSAFGQRWYLNMFDSFGERIFSKALIGATTGSEIQSLTWSNGYCYVVTLLPHGIKVGTTVYLSIVGASPDGYNGKWRMLAVDSMTLTFSSLTNPGTASLTGSLQYNIDLLAGYNFTSTMIFREASQQFETT